MNFKHVCEIHIKFVQKSKLSSPLSVFADARSKFQYRFTRLCFPHSALHITFYLTCKIARQCLAKISLFKCNLIRDSAELSLLDKVEHIEIAFKMAFSGKTFSKWPFITHTQLTTNIPQIQFYLYKIQNSLSFHH